MNSIIQKVIPFSIKVLSCLCPPLAGRLAFELFCRPTKTDRTRQEGIFWQTGQQLELSSGRSAKCWGHGPPVWLLHGWGSRGSTYYKFIPILVKAGFRVIAWDGPAHGDSGGKTVNIVKYARAVASDIKSSQLSVHAIVGHSFGGASLAILDRYLPLPKHLVIIGAPTEIPIVFENFRNFVQLGERAYLIMIKKAEEIIKAPIATTSLIANDLSQKTSVMVVHDKDDKEVPFARFTKLKSLWKEGQFFATSGLGHRRIIKSPVVANKITEFIKI